MKKKAMLVVKRRSLPMMASVIAYNEETGRKGRVLAAEPIKNDFDNDELTNAARRLVELLPDYEVILPVGVEL